MTTRSEHWLVPDGWTREEPVSGFEDRVNRLLWYDIGLCLEHRCVAGDGSLVVNAPSIRQHDVTETDRGVTVSPSILCGGCGLHGFITDSHWKDAGTIPLPEVKEDN